jgi:pimeloyl-ACP methyl ester carboxylesterase
MWDEQFQLFSKTNRVIRYDVRGFGKSSIAKEKFSDARDLHDLLKHLGISKTSIIGVSNGGRITFDFAVEYPTMVELLILVAPGMRGYEMSGPHEEKLWNDIDETMKRQEVAVREGRAEDSVEMDVNAYASAQSVQSRKRIMKIALDNFHASVENPWKLQVSPRPPAFQRLSSIASPALLIVGNRDVPAQILMVDNIHKHMPGSKKILIPGADHIVNMSKPHEFNKAVTDFLNRN